MALNQNVAREQDEGAFALVHTRTFLMVAGALPGLFAATSGENGIALGVFAAVGIVCAAVLSKLLAGITGAFSRISVVLLVVACVDVLLGFALRVAFPVIYQSLGAYLYLAALGGVAALFAAQGSIVSLAGGKELSIAEGVVSAVLAFVALAVTGIVCGLLGTGAVFGVAVAALVQTPIAIFTKPAGSLLVLAALAVIVQATDGRGGAGKGAPAADAKGGAR